MHRCKQARGYAEMQNATRLSIDLIRNDKTGGNLHRK